jgi:Uma2 family endonuclease
MNVQSNLRLAKPEFLRWVQGREGRYELVDSRVVMMTGGSRAHALVVRRLAHLLEQQLDSAKWAVLTSDFGVEVGPSAIRYPDIVVDRTGGRFTDLTATAPVLVVEVVSPSSATTDLGDKAAEYLALSSLAAYVVAAQDEPKAWLWVRGRTGFTSGPAVIEAREARIKVEVVGIDLSLSQIYSDFGTG